MAYDKLDLDVLPDDAKRELIDFYEYLKEKYGKKGKLSEIFNKYKIKLPKDYKFDREEAHER